MKTLCILLIVLRQELYVIYVGSHSVTVAEDVTALYCREENSIFKCVGALHETYTSVPSCDLLVPHHYPSHLAIHTGNL